MPSFKPPGTPGTTNSSDKTQEESSDSVSVSHEGGTSSSSSSGGGGDGGIFDTGFGDELFDDEGSCAVDSHHSTSFADTKGGRTADDDEEDGKVQLAKKENKAVLQLRLLVFDFLIVATIGVSLVVYFTTTGAERNEYESQYESVSETIIQAFHDIANDNLAAAAGMGLDIAVHGEESSAGWPYVTLPRFQEKAATTLSQSGALHLQFNPMVTLEDRQDWEQYTTGEDSYWM